MKFKHSLVYTALFAVPAFTYADEAKTQIDEVVVNTDNSAEEQADSYQSRRSNIANKGATPLIDSPQTVNVVNNKLIEDRKPTSIDEALQTVSGTTQANTLGGIFDAVLKRGFGANRDNSILRNGVIAGPSHNFSATTSRIEVLKGPASVLYGIQDPGGVINIVTKKPQKEAQYVIGASVGSDNLWGANLDFTGPLANGFSYRLIVDRNEKDYWRNFGEVKRGLYAPSLAWHNDKTDVVVAYEHQDYVDPFDRGTYIIGKGTEKGKIVAVSPETRLDEPFNKTTGKIDTISVSLGHKLTDTWKLNAKYGYTRDNYNYWQARVIEITPTQAYRNVEGISNSDSRTHSASVNLVGEFATGNIAHRVVTGVDFTQYELANTRFGYRPSVKATDAAYSAAKNNYLSLTNPQYGRVTQADVWSGTPTNALQHQKLRTVGTYVQDSAYLTDNLILSAGLRYEYYDQIAGNGKNSVTYNTNQHDGKLVYQGGLVYKFTPDWAVYGNYAESFRPQNSVGTPVRSSLDPEKGKSFEVGTKYENAFLSTNLALFNINKENVANGKDSDGYLKLAGKVRSRGIEWDMNGRITDNLGITATYAYTKATVRQDNETPDLVGKMLEGVPKHQAGLFLTYEFMNVLGGNVKVGAGARYQGSWYVHSSNGKESFKLPHAVVSDAFIAYNTKVSGKNVTVQLNGKNLGNKVYYVSTQGAAQNVYPIAYGNPREFVLNTKVEF